ncbi:dipeptide ABC transporter ATP-binding protein [Paracoccus sp. Z118]|uniref:ABC transporter ATP-binding protein n=1 Tax=Paracoccus sp. Z118 TaxID=2851017 RepID=UPI001C2C3614|nr:dipeptide ABC transporter ATP-binding protein [Paracoccus sp. Z118]MBV0890931.1 dipeptide ABC transporter ATP-binding protein [Paracoccus sp. Z118]
MTAPLLQVEHLTKHFPVRRGLLRRVTGAVQAVTDISFSLGAGETLAIVGESGCGKSTAGRTILRLQEPTAGRALLNGRDIYSLSPAELRAARREMQMIFQDPFGSLNPRMTVREVIAEPLRLHGMASGADLDRRIDEVLAKAGLSSWHAGRYPHEFSGGQRQRVGIARALATNPRLIVCDEPVSALDVSVQAQIVNLLQDLQTETGVSYVFISHDLAVVRHIATRVAVMYLGRIVEQADAGRLFADPRHPYTRSLIAAAPRPVPSDRVAHVPLKGETASAMAPPPGCAFHPRCPFAQERCRIDRPELRPVGGDLVACHFAETLPPMPRETAEAESPVLARRLDILAQARKDAA